MSTYVQLYCPKCDKTSDLAVNSHCWNELVGLIKYRTELLQAYDILNQINTAYPYSPVPQIVFEDLYPHTGYGVDGYPETFIQFLSDHKDCSELLTRDGYDHYHNINGNRVYLEDKVVT